MYTLYYNIYVYVTAVSYHAEIKDELMPGRNLNLVLVHFLI